MSRYHNDQPIQGGANDPDLLNRLGFANHLASILLLGSDDDCLTVSLEGEWGYGKTSVINLVKGALAEKSISPIIIEYNPWLAGKPDSLIQDFLLQFSSQLKITDNSEVALSVAKELVAYSSLFSVAKLVPGAEPWASIVEKVFSRFSNSAKKIAELKKLDILGQKNKVSLAIKQIKEPIVVIIDDIDRLTPSETFQILRLIKAVADFSGTSFLLAFDANYLASVLSKNDIVNSSEYLDKVIQLRIPLPVISEISMNQLANIELKALSDKDLTECFDGDQDRLSWIYHKYFRCLIRNPRELKRFFNHLRFVLEQIEGQVCFTDIFSLSLIATKANSVYEHIKRSPEAYIGKSFKIDNILMEKPSDVVKEFESDRDSLLSVINERDRQLIAGLLGDIFPLLDKSNYSYFGVSNDDAAGRVSAIQRLYVALHYQTPLEYISDQEILNFIAGTIDRPEFLKDVLASNAEVRFFEMLNIYSINCKDDSLAILASIYDAFLKSEKLTSPLNDNYGFMIREPYRELNWLTYKLISDSDNKYSLVKGLIYRKENCPLAGDILGKARDQIHGESEEAPWISKNELVDLESEFQSIAVNAIINRDFYDTHLESHIFYELKRSSKEKASELLAHILNSDNGVIRVAEVIERSGRDSVNGPYVQIDDETFSDIINLRDIREKVRAIDIQSQPIHTQAVLKSILDGKKYYLRDGAKGDR